MLTRAALLVKLRLCFGRDPAHLQKPEVGVLFIILRRLVGFLGLCALSGIRIAAKGGIVSYRKLLICRGFGVIPTLIFDIASPLYEFLSGTGLKKSEVAQLGKHE